jgi:hypothetical protein
MAITNRASTQFSSRVAVLIEREIDLDQFPWASSITKYATVHLGYWLILREETLPAAAMRHLPPTAIEAEFYISIILSTNRGW